MLRMPSISTACINDQYRSLHGSLRFLHNIVRFPGCGVFEAESSWVLRDRRDGCPGGNDALFAGCARRGAHHSDMCC